MNKYNLQDNVIFYDWGAEMYLLGRVVQYSYSSTTSFGDETFVIYLIQSKRFGTSFSQQYHEAHIVCLSNDFLDMLLL